MPNVVQLVPRILAITCPPRLRHAQVAIAVPRTFARKMQIFSVERWGLFRHGGKVLAPYESQARSSPPSRRSKKSNPALTAAAGAALAPDEQSHAACCV